MSEPTVHPVVWAPSAIKDAAEHAAEAFKAADGAFARVSTFELSALIDATRALIEHNEQEEAAEPEVERLTRELAAWRSGARRHAWPTIEAVPDGIAYAAHLARAQGTEGGDEHDQLLREASQRMKALHDAAQTLLQERDVLAWLHAEAVWQRDQVARTGAAIQHDLDETLSKLHETRDERNALRANKKIRQAALNGVLGHPASSDYYAAIEEVAQLRKGARDLLAQIQGLGERNRLLQAGLERRNELLGELWLYVKWRYVTGKLTTEQREIWADAVDAFGETQDGKAARWWRDNFVEGNRG